MHRQLMVETGRYLAGCGGVHRGAGKGGDQAVGADRRQNGDGH